MLDKRLLLSARGLCFDHRRLAGCLDELELDVSFRLWPARLLSVDRLRVRSRRSLALRPGPKKDSEDGPPSLPPVPRLGSIEIDLPRLVLAGKPASIGAFHEPGSLRLSAELPGLKVGADGVYEGLKAGFKLDLAAPGKRLTADLSGTPDLVKGRVSVLFSSGAVRELRLSSCEARPSWSLACDARLEPRAMPRPLAGKLKAEGGVSGGDAFSARAELTLGPAEQWHLVSGRIRASAQGRLSELKKTRTAHDFDAELGVPDFARLVAQLRGTPYAVPAPFHVLRGSVSAEARGTAGEIDFTARSTLSSERQKLDMSAKGRLRPAGKRPEVEVELVLREAVLELPRLDLGPPPDVTVDPRIKTPETAEKPKPKPASRPRPGLALRARVKTKKPALLLTNLAKEPVPVALDLLARPPELSGSIEVGTFGVEFFRRRAVIKHFNLRPAPSGAFELDGLLLYSAAEATVRIMVLGTTKKPRVLFISDPPMEREQVIALLLFNKPPDELDEGQQESVGNTQNALASNALGLATLYLFASTPVEYVGYDPASNSYAIRFKLPGGATMEVGSDFDESRHVKLRKRLSSRWAIQSELRDERSGGNVVATFLEWFRRY